MDGGIAPVGLPSLRGSRVTEHTLHEAAERLGVHYMTVYRYVRLGLLPAHKVGGSWRVTEEDLDAFTKPEAGRPDSGDTPWPERLKARMMAGDSVGAWSVVEAAMASGAAPEDVYTTMLAPVMVSIGSGWADGEVEIEEEHLASAVAGRIIGKLGPRFARRGRTRGVVVAATPPGERHGFGVAMIADILRGRGFEVLELGPDLPLDRFTAAVARVPDLVAVCLSVVASEHVDSCAATVAELKAKFPGLPVIVGGSAFGSDEEALATGADASSRDPGEAVEAVLAARSA